MTGSPDISFRTVAHGDIGAVQDLAGRIWREHYPGIISREQIDYMLGKMYTEQVIRDEIGRQGSAYVLVRDGDRDIGFIAYQCDADARAVKISKLYLLPLLHGKGIGRMMLQHVQDQARQLGARGLYLFVNKGNAKAIRAYERFGFRKAGDVVADIGNGFAMDDFRMEMLL